MGALLSFKLMYYQFMFISPQTSNAVCRFLWLSVLIMGLLACAGTDRAEEDQVTPPPTETNKSRSVSTPAVDSPPKTPQGYIRSDVYQPEKYGGFIGDCASDENFPYYWECMSENAGNGLD